MGKSGQRSIMNAQNKIADNPIIERPTLVSKTRHFTEWTLQIIGWILWLFFINPLVTLMLWYISYLFFNYQMFELKGKENSQYFIIGVGALVLTYIVMFAWSRYNSYRFRGKDKRKSSGTATLENIAEYYKVKQEDIVGLQNSRNVDIYFLKDDIIEINSEKASKFRALYAPQNQGKHHDKNIVV